MKSITKIVITGGPCAGKTTAMSWVQNAFTAKGYTVLFIPETATELIGGGLAPWTVTHNVEYQKCQMRLQLEKEKIFTRGANHMPGDKFLLVCDRGAMDNRAYMNDEEFRQVLRSVHMEETALRDSYDAVFHLETAAKGKEEFYTLDNNASRTETPRQAVELDNRLISAWTGHPHLRVIGNHTDFEIKMHTLISQIAAFMGEPLPYVKEKKFLIDYPDVSLLQKDPSCRKVNIIQTYLHSPHPGEQVRVRQRGSDGSFIYFKTIKRQIAPGKRLQVEERLSQAQYLQALMEADTSYHQLRKTRYCLTRNGQYFEVDVFPFWKKVAIMKMNARSENGLDDCPEFIHIRRDITDDESFRNHCLARQAMDEDTL